MRCDCCTVALSPIKDVLQQQGEGCGGRLVQAPLVGASKFEMFNVQTVLCAMFPSDDGALTKIPRMIRIELAVRFPHTVGGVVASRRVLLLR